MAKKVKNMLKNNMVLCVLVLAAIGLASVVFAGDVVVKEGNIDVAGTADIGAYTLPSTDGSDGQMLTTNGSGAVSWQSYGSGVPAGAVMAFAMETVPSGWLECEGQAVSRTTYAALFTTISDDYGNGDGSTTFNLPDYRGYFLRGWDNAAGTDPDAASRTDRGDSTTGDEVGTEQGVAVQSHSHTSYVWNSNQGTATNGVRRGDASTQHGRTTSSDGASETRPKNIGVRYCIKY